MYKNIYDKKKKFKIIYVITQMILLIVLNLVGDNLLYSSYMKDLFILIILLAIIIVPLVFVSFELYKEREKSLLNLFVLLINLVSLFFGTNYMIRTIRAFRYENSYEVYKLNNHFSVNDAKKLKKNIDIIFEKDFNNVSSRDIIIDNFYYDEDNEIYILYLNDYYENYRLKFFVRLDNFKIIDVYWRYDDIKFYLVNNGIKTDKFEYLYAMYIINEVVSEDVSKVTTLEADIEKKIKEKYENIANSMIVYDGVFYDSEKQEFYLSCHTANMDFYGNTMEKEFVVLFHKKMENIKKSKWYYGDSSFDYVQWDVKF